MHFRNNSIIVLILLAFLFRLNLAVVAYCLSGNIDFSNQPDSGSYIFCAEGLIHYASFSNLGFPEIGRTPGFPLLLTIGLIFGHLEIVTIFMQMLFSCAAVYLVFLTSKEIFQDEKAALASASLYAIEPLSVFFSSQILTETLFTSVLMLFLYLFSRYLKTNLLSFLVGAVCTLAAAVYIRPAAYFLPALVVLFLMIRALINKAGTKRLMGHVLIFIATAMLLIGAWQARNYIATGYTGFSSQYVEGLYFYTVPQIMAEKNGGSWEDWRKTLGGAISSHYFEKHPEQRNWNLGQIRKWQKEEAQKFIFENLGTYFRLHLIHIAYTILWPGFDEYWRLARLSEEGAEFPRATDTNLETKTSFLRQKFGSFISRPLGLILGQLSFLFLLSTTYLLAIWGSIRARNNYESVIIIFLICVYFVVIPGTVGSARFRTPIMPLICVLAGFGLRQILNKIGRFSAIGDSSLGATANCKPQ
jgi:hypothetical protein